MLKEKYEDYSEAELLSLCRKVFHVEGDAASHEALVAELDRLVQAPGWDSSLVFERGKPLAPDADSPEGLLAAIQHYRALRAPRRPGLPGMRPPSLPVEPPLVPNGPAMAQREAQRSQPSGLPGIDSQRLKSLIRAEQRTEKDILIAEREMAQINALAGARTPWAWPRAVQLRNALNRLDKAAYRLVPADRFTSFHKQVIHDDVERRRVLGTPLPPGGDLQGWLSRWSQALAAHDGRMGDIQAVIEALLAHAQPTIAHGRKEWISAVASLRKARQMPLVYDVPLADAMSAPLVCDPERLVMDTYGNAENGMSLPLLSAMATQVAATDPVWGPDTCADIYEFGRQAWRCDAYLVTAPLTLVAPLLANNLLYRSRLPLPYRLLLRVANGAFKISLVRVRPPLAPDVPVIQAQPLPKAVGYEVVLPSGERLRWRQDVPLISRHLAYSEDVPIVGRAGPGRWFEPQRLDAASLTGYQEYVVVFPKSSGLEPLYVSGARLYDFGGVTTGAGAASHERWVSVACAQGGGLPAVLTEGLVARPWLEFAELERALWRQMIAVPELANQFTPENQSIMATGNAPVIDGRSLRVGHQATPDYDYLYDLSRLWFQLDTSEPGINA